MATLGSPASVIAAIREDAESEAARIHDATNAELAAIRAEAAAFSVDIADRDERLGAARRDNEERVAKQEWEGKRAVIEQRERWIESVIARAREQWTSADPAKLIEEARAHLPDGPCDVQTDARGGCVVSVGNVSFDNTYEARSRRFESEWRNALSRIYTP